MFLEHRVKAGHRWKIEVQVVERAAPDADRQALKRALEAKLRFWILDPYTNRYHRSKVHFSPARFHAYCGQLGLRATLEAVKRFNPGGHLDMRLKRNLHNVGVRICGVAALGLLAACGSPPPAKAAKPKLCELKTLKASVITSARVNLSEEREARPVQLRIYQLKNDTRFLNARFDGVWRSDAETLGDDLLKVDEVPVYPNSRIEMRVEREEGARFLVAAGLFRNPKGRSWFTSFEFPDPGVEFCESDDGEPVVPEFYVWVEDTRVEDGSAHADEFPEGAGRTLAISAPKAPKEDAPASNASADEGTKLPDASTVESGVDTATKANQKAGQVQGATQSAPQQDLGGGFATELQ